MSAKAVSQTFLGCWLIILQHNGKNIRNAMGYVFEKALEKLKSAEKTTGEPRKFAEKAGFSGESCAGLEPLAAGKLQRQHAVRTAQ